MAEQVATAAATPPATQPPTPAPDGGEWKSRFDEAVKTRDEAKARARSVAEENEGLRKQLDEINRRDQASQEEAKKRQLEAEGKYSEALKVTEDRLTGKYQKLASTATQRLVPLAIRSAAASIESITPEAVQDLPVLLRDHVGLDPETLEVFVKGADGKPLTDSSLKPVPVESFVTEFVKTRPYLMKGTMPASHGLTSAGTSQGFSLETAMGDNAKMAEWAAKDPAGYAKAVKDYYSPAAVLKRNKGK